MIDAALMQGASVIDVAKRFGFVSESLRRHARNHVNVPGPSGKKAAKAAIAAVSSPVEPAEAPQVLEIAPVSLRSPDDVLTALEWSVAETKALLQRAKEAGDLNLQNKLLLTAIGALDKLAKSTGLYDDGAKITVNTAEQKTLNVFAEMTTEQLRAMKGASPDRIRALVKGLTDGE